MAVKSRGSAGCLSCRCTIDWMLEINWRPTRGHPIHEIANTLIRRGVAYNAFNNDISLAPIEHARTTNEVTAYEAAYLNRRGTTGAAVAGRAAGCSANRRSRSASFPATSRSIGAGHSLGHGANAQSRRTTKSCACTACCRGSGQCIAGFIDPGPIAAEGAGGFSACPARANSGQVVRRPYTPRHAHNTAGLPRERNGPQALHARFQGCARRIADPASEAGHRSRAARPGTRHEAANPARIRGGEDTGTGHLVPLHKMHAKLHLHRLA